jgi:hypothetical protein
VIAYTPALASGQGPDEGIASGLGHWPRTHRSTIAVAGLLSFAGPATFLAGSLSVMTEATLSAVTTSALWFLLYGCLLWCLLLVSGYLLLRFDPPTRLARGALTLVLASVSVLVANVSTAGRVRIFVEHGIVANQLTMQLYSSTFTLTMSLLFFAHLRSSRKHEAAAARLAVAQAAHLESRRRSAQMRLQAVQARVDPQLLFAMLEAVRQCYEHDASRAERLLDELIAFLRAALPRLRSTSSSVACEAELARAYAQLHALAGAVDVSMTLDLSPEALGARFPPGVLLPLLDDALRARAGPCWLLGACARDECRVALTLPMCPSDAALDRVRALLLDLYGASASLAAEMAAGGAIATIKVPHEPS